MALPDISLLYNYKGAAYPVNLTASNENTSSSPVPTLVDVCCQYVVRDAHMTEATMRVVPTELCYSLMKAAIFLNRDRSTEILISNWPWEKMSLHKFAPMLFDNLKVLHSDQYLNERIRKGVRYTTCLAHTFVECLKKRAPTKLKHLDLSGYPAAEVIVNYMSSHVLLVYNEARQKDIIRAYNAVTKDMPKDRQRFFEVDSTLPEESYIVTMDAFLQTADTHMELCKALRASANPHCRFKLRINKLDIMCLGIARTSVLLEQIDPLYLTALCLQFNGLCNDALALLVPWMKQFKELRALDMSCNSIMLGSQTGDQSPTALMADLLASLPKLVRLDLSNNRTKHRLSDILASVTQPLEYLKLCGCGLSELDIAYLRTSHHASRLTELDISGNDLSRYWNMVVDLLLAVRGNLLVLEMEECDLDMLNLAEFFPILNSFQQLRYLNISRNKLWTMAVVKTGLCRLAHNLTLQAVRLSYPAECYSIAEPNFIEEETMNYTQEMLEKLEMLCQRLGRPAPMVIFIP